MSVRTHIKFFRLISNKQILELFQLKHLSLDLFAVAVVVLVLVLVNKNQQSCHFWIRKCHEKNFHLTSFIFSSVAEVDDGSKQILKFFSNWLLPRKVFYEIDQSGKIVLCSFPPGRACQ